MDFSWIFPFFFVAFMPILEVLIISGLGAFMATPSLDLLSDDARKSLNKIVFTVFTPSLTFASLAKTVNFHDILSWWFMPFNVALTFICGAFLGKLLVKLVKPKAEMKGLIVAFCSAANLGNLVLILIPAICRQDGSPFGDHLSCKSVGLSYTALSMALGGLYMWTFTYQMVRNASIEFKKSPEARKAITKPYCDLEADDSITQLIDEESRDERTRQEENGHNDELPLEEAEEQQPDKCYDSLIGFLRELKAPPTIGAILGLLFGTVSWLHYLIIGDHAPLRIIQDCAELLGRGTIPCITLIMGGNLREGFGSGKLKKSVILGVIVVKYLLLPVIGLVVVRLADFFGFLPPDPLYHFILMVQFTLPPAMNIGTMTELFDVGQKECAVLFLWTYAVSAIALTTWCTLYMWIIS